MDDYSVFLNDDLLEQFKEKPNLKALVDVIGEQLQSVYDFYEQLRTERTISTAVGAQLDGIGDIECLNRVEAGLLTGNPIPYDILEDDIYRKYLTFKILKNTSDCTYPDIMKAFAMFWDRPLYYREDPEQPATMILDTGEMQGLVDTSPLFETPLIRAAGVTLKIYATTSTKIKSKPLKIASGLGYSCTTTDLPNIELDYQFDGKVSVGSSMATVTQDRFPGIELRYMSNGVSVQPGNAVYSTMTTPIGDATVLE